jgi:hypothetical protein
VPQSRFARLVQRLRCSVARSSVCARTPITSSGAIRARWRCRRPRRACSESASLSRIRRRQYDEGAGTRGCRICFDVRSKQACPCGQQPAAGLGLQDRASHQRHAASHHSAPEGLRHREGQHVAWQRRGDRRERRADVVEGTAICQAFSATRATSTRS